MEIPLGNTPKKRPFAPESNSVSEKSLVSGDDEPARSPNDINIKAITEIDSVLILAYMKPADSAGKAIPDNKCIRNNKCIIHITNVFIITD